MRSDRVLASVDDLPRLAVTRALREHPEWSLQDVFSVIASGGPLSELLGCLTVAELLSFEPRKSGRTIDRARLRRAKRAVGAEFDQLVFEVLCEAPGDVGRAYLVARLGGPRWKLQASLGRLVAANKVSRSGKTSTTGYRAVRLRA